jgi:hypothetical protein
MRSVSDNRDLAENLCSRLRNKKLRLNARKIDTLGSSDLLAS